MASAEAKSINGRGERIKHLFTLIEKEPAHAEEWYHGKFLNAWAVQPRTWNEYLDDCFLMYDLIWVYDPEISKDFRVIYVRYQWTAIRNEREEKRVKGMKAANFLKLTAFEE